LSLAHIRLPSPKHYGNLVGAGGLTLATKTNEVIRRQDQVEMIHAPLPGKCDQHDATHSSSLEFVLVLERRPCRFGGLLARKM
jgi:hypothetical protein